MPRPYGRAKISKELARLAEITTSDRIKLKALELMMILHGYMPGQTKEEIDPEIAKLLDAFRANEATSSV